MRVLNYYIRVLIPYTCLQNTEYVPAYLYIRVFILPYTCSLASIRLLRRLSYNDISAYSILL